MGAEACQYLEEYTVPGRRWACGLYRQHGDWQKVHIDPRYLANVKPYWDTTELAGQECGEWPRPGVSCPVCGGLGE
jgi:hypothetical protein